MQLYVTHSPVLHFISLNFFIKKNLLKPTKTMFCFFVFLQYDLSAHSGNILGGKLCYGIICSVISGTSIYSKKVYSEKKNYLFIISLTEIYNKKREIHSVQNCESDFDQIIALLENRFQSLTLKIYFFWFFDKIKSLNTCIAGKKESQDEGNNIKCLRNSIVFLIFSKIGLVLITP